MTSDIEDTVQAQASKTVLADAMRDDRPCTEPGQDKFGYMPTATVIARTIRNAPAGHGLVLHVDGEWGSGKSSMLGLIRHVLEHPHASTERPIKPINFNPWWFSDHEHLAQQFLAIFRSQLPHENQLLIEAGKLIAKYSDALAGVVAAGVAAKGIPVPPGAVKTGVAAFFRRLVLPKKDVPELKREIEDKLLKSDERLVVFIDDVDRLTPAEINEVFRVVKAVADFPNVVYVLAFDREVVAQALFNELRVDGPAYLEKIVQVPFVLPTLRADRLRDLLIENVQQLAPDVRFEPAEDAYEANVLASMGDLLRRPRDLVRFANAFAPACAGLQGDVPAVDIAALELLRVVEPRVYRSIRDHERRFLGDLSSLEPQPRHLAALDADWGQGMTDARRTVVVRLLDRLFPQRTPRAYSTTERQEWESRGRICSERGYTTYFRQQRPDDELMPRELAPNLGASRPRCARRNLASACRRATTEWTEQGHRSVGGAANGSRGSGAIRSGAARGSFEGWRPGD